MDSEESYNVNDDQSEEDFDPDDSAPHGLRARPYKNVHTGGRAEPQPRESRRQTRGIRNANYSQSVRIEQADGHENIPQRQAYGELDDDLEEDPDAQRDDAEPESVFAPNIDVILHKKHDADGKLQYLVKFKNRSYLHLAWLSEPDLIDTAKSAKNKLNRFNKTFDRRLIEPEEDDVDAQYFDPSYVQVDRVLATTAIFPVVHQKKANEIRGKWSQSLFLVCQKLLNFSREYVHYGVFFCEPVNPEAYPDYRRLVTTPMDLGTIINRVLLDNYKTPLEFWQDVGLVWKNCRKFNENLDADMRVIGETLREASVVLYRQWWRLAKERWESMKQEWKTMRANEEKENAQNGNKEKIETVESMKEKEPNADDRKQKQEIAAQNGSKHQEIPKEGDITNENPNSNPPIEKMEIENDPQVIQKIAEEPQVTTEKVEAPEVDVEMPQSEQPAPVSIQQQDLPVEEKIAPAAQVPEQKTETNQAEPNQAEKSQKSSKLDKGQPTNPNAQNIIQAQPQPPRPNEELVSSQGSHIQVQQPSPPSQHSSLPQQPCKNILLQRRKADLPLTQSDLQKFNPGPYTFSWLLEQSQAQQPYQQYTPTLLTKPSIHTLSLNTQIDRLYLIKWKNLSYTQATWQRQSSIGGHHPKVLQFRTFNRALDKQSRIQMINQNQRHKTLLQAETNPRKKARLGYSAINQIRNKLYSYDVRQRKREIPQYTNAAPPVFKDYKLLRDYQLESLNWLIASWYHNRNVILADQMGLGKTIQSISFLNHLSQIEGCRGPFLVIAPLSTLEHWKRTVQDWINLNCVLYYDHNGQPGRASIRYYQWHYTDISTKGSILQATDLHKFHILITSFEVFLADFQTVMQLIPFQFVVVDQAHRLKNQNAKILLNLKQLPCKRILLLTGTPIQNNTDELWSLLNYIEPDRFSRREDFRRDFGDLESSEQIQRLHALLKPYLLRRMKEDVEQSIPPLQETIIDIEMTTLQKTIYRALYERNKGMLTKGLSGSSVNTSLNNLEMQLRKCCNHPFLIKQIESELMKDVRTEQERIGKLLQSSGKMTLVNKLLDKYSEQGKKVLIFSQFTHMLLLLQQLLKSKGVKYQKIDGQIKAKQRQNSIDRYNNPQKKRQVFLLSTKAGGIGINLTSANIVIIFDSDWNPQNDVQATARAHRIGQVQQVQVYRLVTAKTYEAEMFERAARKLGLDQAIFIDGTFKTTRNQVEEERRKKTKSEKNKLSKNQLETLLRRGMLGLYEETRDRREKGGEGDMREEGDMGGRVSMQGRDVDVEDILAKNSRIAKYSVIQGSYSFAKSRFVSEQADNKLNLHDPDFWNIVLKNIESKSQKLLKKLEDDPAAFKLAPVQQQLMLDLSDLVNSLIESKLSLSGYNADDQKNLVTALSHVSASKFFSKTYRDMSSVWLDEISKPSRRFKKMTLQDFQAQLAARKARRDQQAGEKVFVDQPGFQDDEDDRHNKYNPKLDDVKKDEMIRKLCYLCERPKCTFYCRDFCKRGFHRECRRRVEGGEVNTDGPTEKIEIEELNLDDETLKAQINNNYRCVDCHNQEVVCFICKQKGKYFGAEYHKKKDKGNSASGNSVLRLIKKQGDEAVVIEQDPPVEPDKPVKRKNDVTKCSTANCAKFFHPKCIENFDGNSKFKYIDQKNLHFRCSLHYCFKCGQSGDTMAIAQCIRCPRAFHLRCMDKDRVCKVTKKLFVCDRHNKKKSKQDRKPIKQLLKKMVKHSKYEERMREQEEDIGAGTKRTRSMKKEAVLKVPKLAPTEPKKVTYTYQELEIQPPWDFDFDKYPEDWCRYCGARFSSNFTQGPWGPKTLCTVHYINWKKKRALQLDEFTDKPSKPINPHDDQELRYISSLKAKDPSVDLKDFLVNGGFEAYRKHMKKSLDTYMM